MAILAVTVFFGACSGSGSNDDDGIVEERWSYGNGVLGPAAWASLDPEFAACGSGQSQSPIDITVDAADDVRQFEFDYRVEDWDVENDGHTLIFHASSGADVTLDGVEYDLDYFHFHVPSEHKLKGAAYDGEIHFYHTSKDGRKVAVAVWVQAGILNKVFGNLILNAPLVRGERIVDSLLKLNPSELLPADKTYYRYSGSLSEPPCTEPVEWIVLRNPIEASTSQLAFFTNQFGDNIRPVQPLNGRAIIQE